MSAVSPPRDASLKPDPKRKGSYYRRIEDIDRALQKLGVGRMSPSAQFLTYFFACEKLAHGVVGIVAARPAADQYSPRARLSLNKIKQCSVVMGLSIPAADLDWLFADHNEQYLLVVAGSLQTSARLLRNNLTHDFGPTNAEKLVQHASALIPKMQAFLNCARDVLAYQRANFAHVS
jgi:hypothetical protein